MGTDKRKGKLFLELANPDNNGKNKLDRCTKFTR